MKIQVLFVIALMVLSAAADKESSELEPFLFPQRYCGHRLAQSMAFVCNYFSKRSGPNSLDYGYAPYQQVPWPWMRHHGRDEFEISRGKRQGIVDECCNQSCSIDVLLSYC